MLSYISKRRGRSVLGSTAVMILMLLAAACGSDEPRLVSGNTTAGEVTLRADATRYAPGDKPKLTLSNNSEGDVGYNLCFAFIDLERNEGGTWKPVTAHLGPPDTACTAPLFLLKPGATANGELILPTDLAPGTYRLVHKSDIEGARQPIATDAFEVI